MTLFGQIRRAIGSRWGAAREWCVFQVAAWRLWRGIGTADALTVVRLSGELSRANLLGGGELLELVRRAGRSVRHGADMDYLRRALPAWADQLAERRWAEAMSEHYRREAERIG